MKHVLCWLALWCVAASAATLELSFEGTITSSTNLSSIPTGATFSGVVRYRTDAPVQNVLTDMITYGLDLGVMEITVGGITFLSESDAIFNVINDQFSPHDPFREYIDGLFFGPAWGSAGSVRTRATLSFLADQDTFSSLLPPTALPPLSDSFGPASVFFLNENGEALGYLSSLSLTTVDAPEPGAVLALVSGLALVFSFRRSRRSQ